MYTFIVNPNAKTGLGYQVWSSLEAILKEKNVNYQVFFTKYQKHATRLAQKLTQESGAKTLIVLGGDGTINEVINGIEDLDGTVLGYIPIGSSNDFARGMGLSTDPVQALKHILSPEHFTYINIGTAMYAGKTRRFAVSSGLGFDAGVCHQVYVSKLKKLLNKLHLGKLSYAAVALQQILTMTPSKMTLTLDDNTPIELYKTYFATAMNQKVEGGGFKFCPKADPTDDMLDVIAISDISKLKILTLLPTAFFGWHVRFRGVHVYRCKKAVFQSERPLPVHTDGEPVFLQQEITYSLENKKLRLILS